jgi:hypothetical protein
VTREEAMECRIRHDQPDPSQFYAKFIKGDVLAGIPQGQDFLPPRFDAPRPGVATLGLGRKAPSPPPLRLPPDRCRWRHAKPRRCRTATHPAINRCHKPRSQIH